MNELSVNLQDATSHSLVISATPASEEFCREFHDALIGRSRQIFGFELRRKFLVIQDPTEQLHKYRVAGGTSKRMRMLYRSGNFGVEVVTDNPAFGFIITPR